jgi:hypothetical protein
MILKHTFPLFGVIWLITGCTNFQAVNTAAGQLVSAASTWDSFADEFQASCIRRNQVSDVTSDCSQEKKDTTSLKAADKILSAYFTALQQVSKTQSFSVDSGISNLSNSIQSIPGANPSQIKAASGLATFLADIATKGIEERTIDILISNSSKAVDTINVLNTIVAPQLLNIYRREKTEALATFSSYILKSGESAEPLKSIDCSSFSTHSFNSGNSYLLAQAYCSKISPLEKKISALNSSYKSSLNTSKSILDEMEKGKDNLGAKDFADQLISEVSNLKSNIDNINQAF